MYLAQAALLLKFTEERGPGFDFDGDVRPSRPERWHPGHQARRAVMGRSRQPIRPIRTLLSIEIEKSVLAVGLAGP